MQRIAGLYRKLGFKWGLTFAYWFVTGIGILISWLIPNFTYCYGTNLGGPAGQGIGIHLCASYGYKIIAIAAIPGLTILNAWNVGVNIGEILLIFVASSLVYFCIGLMIDFVIKLIRRS